MNSGAAVTMRLLVVGSRERTQVLGQAGGECPRRAQQRGLHQRVPVLEVAIDGGTADAGFAGDAGDARGCQSIANDATRGGVEEPLPGRAAKGRISSPSPTRLDPSGVGDP